MSIIVDTVQNFNEANAAEGAASMAYYALFSLFPLLIFLIGFVSSVLEDQQVQQPVLDFVDKFLPTAQTVVKENIELAVSLRDTVRIVGTIGLLWAATAVFSALAHNINRAWHTAPQRNFLFGRLVGLAMVASLTGLLLLWVISITVISVLPQLDVPILGGADIYRGNTWRIISQLIPLGVIFFTFLNLYRWVPNTKVRWREALWGAGVAAVGWELAVAGFRWYLTSGLARYQLIYGSLGAVVALMLWIYVSSLIVIFGAHLSATIAMHTRLKNQPRHQTKKGR